MKDKYPLKPLYDENSEILILGSFPGEKSKNIGFYYADKRNQFWNLLSEVYKETIPDDPKGRESFLKKHHIALWDVCEKVEREGSLDKNLKEKKPNNLKTVLMPYSRVRTILCNGKKAHDLFRKYNKDLESNCLISSSGSANAYSKERKKQWKELLLRKK